MGHRITKKEAIQMGLLKPDELTQPATRLAGGSAASEWIDPKAALTSMQMPKRPRALGDAVGAVQPHGEVVSRLGRIGGFSGSNKVNFEEPGSVPDELARCL